MLYLPLLIDSVRYFLLIYLGKVAIISLRYVPSGDPTRLQEAFSITMDVTGLSKSLRNQNPK